MGDYETAWWRSATIYQVYPRSFADSDGDGVGDIAGIIDRLDYLVSLGVDVLWLSPVCRSPQADNGYDISDYHDIDPLFGTLGDFDSLVEAVHARGMKLVMDLVVNHTSDEHEWFVASRSSRDNPKRDWYVWSDPDDGHQPNNWGSFFGGSAWELDPVTGQYYLHLFDKKQPDLNWENAEVRSAVYAMMRWWLDRGVDGFRMDVINFISKADGLPDAPNPFGDRFVNAFSMFADGPRIHEFMTEMHREVFAGREPKVLTVGEMPGVTTEQARLYTGEHRGELNMVFQFEHVQLDRSEFNKFDYRGADLAAVREVLHRWQCELANTGWNSLYWNNHDQPRVVSRYGDDDPAYWYRSATTLATVLHAMRGTPFVYQGEEIGMTNYPFTRGDEHRDPEAANYYASLVERGLDGAEALTGLARVSRDNARTPMQWDDGANAGFTTGDPWLPVNPNYRWLNVEAQVDDPASVFAHYRTLIRLRHEHAIFVDGDFEPLLEDDPRIWAFTRSTAGEQMLMVANCGRDPRTVTLDEHWLGADLLVANSPSPTPLDEREVELGWWESRIYLRRVV